MDENTSSLSGVDYQVVFDASLDASIIHTSDGEILAANWTAVERYGYSLTELKQMNIAELSAHELRADLSTRLGELQTLGEIFEWEHRRKDETELPVEIYAQPIIFYGELAILSNIRDITERKRAEALLAGQYQVLGMIASGEPLADILTALVSCIEEQSVGMLGSILLLDPDGIHVRHGAAPSLPAEFNAAVDGQPIGPVAGSCGTAAYRKEAVFVEDIATDPLWVNYKAAAIPHGLRACWSTPIFDEQGQILGTFAMYYREPGLPQAEHLKLIETTTHIASIAISRYRSEKVLSESEARYRLLFDYAPDGIVIADTESYYLDANASACQLLGYSRHELIGLHASDIVIEAELDHIEPALEAIKASSDYAREWRMRRKDGSTFIAEVKATTMPDGKLLGVIRDISERKGCRSQSSAAHSAICSAQSM